ncbi:hypothetical protein GGG16DRAFT_119583 [Schizophyllum commune]
MRARHLTRQAAVLIDVLALPVRAPSTTSSHLSSSPTSRHAVQVFSCDTEPPEARVRTPRAKDTKVKDPFILKPTRAGGLGPLSIFSQTRTAGGARGPTSTDDWGNSKVLFASPRPPEACARSLGVGRERGRAPLTLSLDLVFAEPPEASAGSLGEGCKGGGGTSTHARVKRKVLRARGEFLTDPSRRRHARAPSVKDVVGVGYPSPLAMNRQVDALMEMLPRRMIRKGWVAPTPRARLESVAALPCAHNMLTFLDHQPPEACARTLGEGCERGGIPLTPHGSLARRRERRGTAPFVEGSSLARPTTSARRPERALRVLLREGEALHVRGGRGEIRTTRYSALHANALAFKIPETDIFDEKDPSPSSLPTSSRSSPTS